MPRNKQSREGANAFKNDGSFLELFRKKLEQEREEQRLDTPENDNSINCATTTSKSSNTSHSSNTTFSSVGNDEKEVLSRSPSDVTSLCSDKAETLICISSGVPESSSTTSSHTSSTSSQTKKASLLSFVGKRRGSKPTLKTGVVKKKKTEDDEEEASKEPWAQYLNEVKKYRNQICSEDDSNRPLVK